MLKRFTIIAAGLAASVLCCSAAFAQASAAKPVAQPLPVYLLSPKETLNQHLDYPECWCANGYNECVKLARKAERAKPTKSPFNFSKPEPEIREIDLEGLKKILQRDPKDTRPLLINFWATWCDGCREEFPDLVKIDNEYKGKGLNFVAVSLDDVADVKSKVLPFLKEMKANMSQVLLSVNDPEPAIHFVDPTWQGDMPATFLYDKDGKVVFKFFGPIKPDELRAAINKQVGSKQ